MLQGVGSAATLTSGTRLRRTNRLGSANHQPRVKLIELTDKQKRAPLLLIKPTPTGRQRHRSVMAVIRQRSVWDAAVMRSCGTRICVTSLSVWRYLAVAAPRAELGHPSPSASAQLKLAVYQLHRCNCSLCLVWQIGWCIHYGVYNLRLERCS